jgi:DNA-directed RNA polymerase subunit RPC12/RpoP
MDANRDATMKLENMACDYCGEKEWAYLGEAYDDDEYVGSLYMCLECGHHQLEGEGEEENDGQ